MKRNSIMILLLLLVASIANAQQDRGIGSVQQTTVPVGTRYAIVVGISKYENHPVTVATNDAKLVKTFLSNNGFYEKNILLFTDNMATRGIVVNKLNQTLQVLKPKDELVLYFSMEYYEGTLLFFHHESEKDIAAYSLEGKNLKEYLDRYAQKGVKITVIFEGSYAGTLAHDWNPEINVLYACGSTEASRDENFTNGANGVFTFHMIEGLLGKADTNTDNAVTLEEELTYLKMTLRANNQTPQVSGSLDKVVLKVDQTMKPGKETGAIIIAPSAK